MLVEELGLKQYKVFQRHGVVFQSYSFLVAFKDANNKVYLTDKWDYNKTTFKHLNIFLRTVNTRKEILKKIDTQAYQLVSENFILEQCK